MNELPIRKQIRLSGYDYSQNGCYFVTICTQNKICLFGEIVDDKMMLNNVGKIVENVWETLPQHHPVELDTFQIMPNHIHLIIYIVGAGFSRPNNDAGFSRPTLGQIIGYFKYQTTKQINNMFQTGTKMETGPVGAGSSRPPIIQIWQRNYYEHIIRNEDELCKISNYISSNPEMWDRDRNNPEHK